MTVEDLWNRYEKHLEGRLTAGSIEQARVDDVRSIAERHILPAFGEDEVASITSEKIGLSGHECGQCRAIVGACCSCGR